MTTHRVTFVAVNDGRSEAVTKATMYSIPRVGEIVKLLGELDMSTASIGLPKTASYRVTWIEHEVDPKERVQFGAHKVTVGVTPLVGQTKEPVQ